MSKELAKVLTGEIDRAVACLEPMWDAVPVPVEDTPTARMMPFVNRFSAGCQLAKLLTGYARSDAAVLGISKGGLAVAQSMALELRLPLDVWLVQELRPLWDPEVALGVITEGANLVLDRVAVSRSGLLPNQIRAVLKDAAEEMALDARRYRRDRRAVMLANRPVILVADGLASAGVMSASIEGVRRRGARKVIVAAPVGCEAAVATLVGEADEVVCLMMPPELRRVGVWYQDYRQLSDAAVTKILSSVPLA